MRGRHAERDRGTRIRQQPQLWRAIAIVNNVDDPLRLAPGTRLVIPRLPFRHLETGEVYQ